MEMETTADATSPPRVYGKDGFAPRCCGHALELNFSFSCLGVLLGRFLRTGGSVGLREALLPRKTARRASYAQSGATSMSTYSSPGLAWWWSASSIGSAGFHRARHDWEETLRAVKPPKALAPAPHRYSARSAAYEG
eukprot:scaffold14600_cov110-Isochrysis_galbana.AAC.1